MKTGRGSWALVGVVAGSVLLLLAGYVGAYFAVVDWIFFDGERAPLYITPFDATYKTVDRFFWPMHAVDRNCLRYKWWHEPPSGPLDDSP